jgi:hypothetical protein
VQPEARDVKLLRPGRCVEPRQHAGYFVRMLRVDLAAVVVFVKAAKAAIPKAPNHRQDIQ